MLLQKVLISKIKIPETRVTAVYDEEQSKLLRETIAKLGILSPIIVTHDGDDYLLVDGLHRVQEAQRAGDGEVDAVVYEGDAKEALLQNLVLNRVRGKVKASEMVDVIASLFQHYGMDSDAIRDATGLSRDYIERLLQVATAAPSVREALDAETITVGHAYEVSRLPTREQQDMVIAKLAIWRWKVADVKEMVDNTLAEMAKMKDEPPPKSPPPKPKYQCEICQDEVDPKHLRPIIVCPNCYGEVWKQRRQTEPETKKEPAATEG